MPYRFETDEHGQIILSPWESPVHGARAASISRELGCFTLFGRTIISCPISTRKGAKAADVAWYSLEIWRESEGKQLYFDAGAVEFWLCSEDGAMTFSTRDAALPASLLCPEFPQKID